MDYQIRFYNPKDEESMVALWNRCVPCDPVTRDSFRRKVLLDPNFDERGSLVAEAHGETIGFVHALRRRYPYYDIGLEPEKGWITIFFVSPEWTRHSVATALFDRAESFLSGQNVSDVFVSNYTPHYFVPGIDVDAHAPALEFLKNRGYEKVLSVYGMGRPLHDFSIPADIAKREEALRSAGFSIQLFRPEHILGTVEFLRQFYPGDLFRVAIERLTEHPECDEILVALKNGAVVGFSHFLEDHFGPFGIHPDYMGRGLGPLLYYKTAEQMKKKGRERLWLAWTTGKAKDFYHKVGLTVLRRHSIMRKGLAH